jgi:transcriptional regulator with XRE-family HTH domain
MSDAVEQIPGDELAELWFGFKQQVLDKLQSAFRRSKMKQEELAARLGLDPATVSRCLRGRRDMGLRTMYELARGMGYRLRIEIDRLDEVQPVNRERGEAWGITKPSAATTSGTVYISNPVQVFGTAGPEWQGSAHG